MTPSTKISIIYLNQNLIQGRKVTADIFDKVDSHEEEINREE